MLFHRIFFVLLCLVGFSCTDITNIESNEDEDQMGKLVAAQITELTTTGNALGSFIGDQLPNLQMDDLEPGEFTLQFEVVEPPTDGLGFATYAYVSWKVAGQQVSRIISVYNGSAISGVANAVHVTLQDQSARTGASVLPANFNLVNGSANFTTTAPITLKEGQLIQFFFQPGVWYVVPRGMVGTAGTLDRAYTGPAGASLAWTLSTYKVAVALSRGTRATTMQPPVLLTQLNESIASGASLAIPLPPSNAGVISALCTCSVSPPNDQTQAGHGIVTFQDANLILLTRYVINSFPMWYPVPPGTATVTFQNTSTTTSLNFSIQWGVEG